MLAFVTVGSTKFDALVNAVLSTPVISSLRAKGYVHLVVQCGNSNFDAADLAVSEDLSSSKDGVDIQLWRFKPTLKEEYERADLVISHAGSGTILDVLRLGKPLIVVPNPTLLDNHQEDLASSLSTLGHLKASTVDELPQKIRELDVSLIIPFPPLDSNKFRNLLDEEMGYI
ncbi:glycosyltransferase family 1 protein [Plicaturopsis crispa FD-325 SS-3]|nr:glycosyltransferase family 1 protein [Plicaturopsis crispa FD-325 SS-3]